MYNISECLVEAMVQQLFYGEWIWITILIFNASYDLQIIRILFKELTVNMRYVQNSITIIKLAFIIWISN